MRLRHGTTAPSDGEARARAALAMDSRPVELVTVRWCELGLSTGRRTHEPGLASRLALHAPRAMSMGEPEVYRDRDLDFDVWIFFLSSHDMRAEYKNKQIEIESRCWRFN